jgi:hypothetical protein
MHKFSLNKNKKFILVILVVCFVVFFSIYLTLYQNKSKEMMQYHYDTVTENLEERNKNTTAPNSSIPDVPISNPIPTSKMLSTSLQQPTHSPSAYSLSDVFSKIASYF